VSGAPLLLTKVTVSLYLLHTYDADLQPSLISPNGTLVILSSFHGSGGDNYGRMPYPNHHFATCLRPDRLVRPTAYLSGLSNHSARL
jgi:hypothetical protein